jgi:pimeloyl-ACP methyl ester carboxylesterase
MPRVTVNGKSLYYTGLSKEATNTPPLIFLYGVGGDHRLWLPVTRTLKGFHRYIPDLAGHGRTGGRAARPPMR